MAIPYSDISPFASNRLYVNGGEAAFDRNYLTSAGGGTSSGDVRFIGFTALHTETCNNITSYTGTTACAATPTLCRMGVYQVDPTTGNLTLLAATANDTTLWSATLTRYVRPLTVPFNKVANSFYMLGYIVVSSFATMNLLGASNAASPPFINATCQQIPPSLGRVTGQSDLPTSIAAANYAVASIHYFMEVLP